MFQVISVEDNEDNVNDASLVLKVSFGEVDFMFTGDISDDKDMEIVESARVSLDIEIPKVAHHGSRYATSSKFLEATTPEVGVIQVGPNSYGHPTSDALGRLAAYDVDVYRNDLNGNVVITTDGSGWDVSTQRG